MNKRTDEGSITAQQMEFDFPLRATFHTIRYRIQLALNFSPACGNLQGVKEQLCLFSGEVLPEAENDLEGSR